MGASVGAATTGCIGIGILDTVGAIVSSSCTTGSGMSTVASDAVVGASVVGMSCAVL